MRSIELKVLKKIKPSEEENQKSKTILNNFIKENLIEFKTQIGGSLVKDTNLLSKKESDVYVLLKELKDFKMVKHNLKKFRPRILKGSRDILQIKQEGIIIEIVPVHEINKEQIENSIDASIYHAQYVNKYLKKPDEVRLLKQFLKANNLYGAESHMQGLSGYACELLIIKYGSFFETIKKFKFLKQGSIIRFDNQKITQKHYEAITIIDPVLKSRNVGASLSLKNFEKLKKISYEYIKNPSISFFEKENLIKRFEEQGKLISIKLSYRDEKRLSQAHKRIKKFCSIIKSKGVQIFDYGIYENKSFFAYVVCSTDKIPSEIIRKGPPLNMEKDVKIFMKKHDNTFVKDNVLYAKIVQKQDELKKLLGDAL